MKLSEIFGTPKNYKHIIQVKPNINKRFIQNTEQASNVQSQPEPGQEI